MEEMRLTINNITYPVKYFPPEFPNRPCFEIENFVGRKAQEEIILDCRVLTTAQLICVTTANFTEFTSVCNLLSKTTTI